MIDEEIEGILLQVLPRMRLAPRIALPTQLQDQLLILREALLAQIFNHARQERLITFNPCDEVGKAVRKKIPARVRRNRFLHLDEEPKLIEQLKDRREHLLPAVRLALWTGMRRGEILRLRRDRRFDSDRRLQSFLY